jgi:hypothetical protein
VKFMLSSISGCRLTRPIERAETANSAVPAAHRLSITRLLGGEQREQGLHGSLREPACLPRYRC